MADAFDSLSIEINQMIGKYLDEDRDLASYRLVCRSTNQAIDEDERSFWRVRFLQSFDPPLHTFPSRNDRSTINTWYMNRYKCRQYALRQRFRFRSGNTKAELECLSTIRCLISESFTGSDRVESQQSAYSNNMERIREVVTSSGLLDRVLSHAGQRNSSRGIVSSANPLLNAIQLSLAHISLTAQPGTKPSHVWGFPDSQTMAYMPESRRPIFKGPNNQEIDIEWTLHVANFFKHYLLDHEQIAYKEYQALDAAQRPQCWNNPLSTSPKELGTHWKGCYAFLDRSDVDQIRSEWRDDAGDAVQDHLSGEDNNTCFQSLSLAFPCEGEQHVWPDSFERILKSRTKIRYKTATTRAQKKALGPDVFPYGEPVSFRFDGDGEDGQEPFLASGHFNPLPPQREIPGWQRMTMMKYWTEPGTNEIDMNSLWAYEGVVLPGGKIMLGRWWHPSPTPGDEYSGPFIFWNVEPST